MPNRAHFTPELFRFLRELEAHNDRDWFLSNKARYEQSVRDPFLRFVADLRPRLKKISPHFIADPSPVGGSMMRIHRDTRFSKDKTPYKTAVMAHFRHDKGKEGATPAFFLRLRPGESTVGAGIWRPEPDALKRIRTAIAGNARSWQRIREGRELGSRCAMAGESLKRPPAGFDADHPHIEDLKRKDFATTLALDDKQVAGDDFLDELIDGFRATSPFLQFLTKAIGLAF
jgi:uncharacterized protein (TIGR02453 family)